MAQVISDQILKAQTLCNGLQKNIELVKPIGITQQLIQMMESEAKQLDERNQKQDQMRAELQQYSRQTSEILNKLKDQIQQAKKSIKQNYTQEKWISFGVVDKR